MIIVRLSSGVGNQLFQFTFANYLKTKFNQEIYFDINRFNVTKQRNCEINIISDNISIYKNEKLFSNYSGNKFRIKKTLFKLNPRNKFIDDSLIITDLQFHNSIFYYFDGYWQNHYYLSQINDSQNLFRPIEPIPDPIKRLLDPINITESVAVHVRRGDYFSPTYEKRYAVCTEQYYAKAMTYIQERIVKPNFYIFSDEIDWVKKNISFPSNTVFIANENINSFWYIYVMSQCKHNIISNSTFSWWGAYLNANESKIVLSPDRWMLDSNTTIALEEWIKIKVK